MGCGASSGGGGGSELDHLKDATVTGAGIAAFQVTGAGTEHVNGIYARHGMYESHPVFKKGGIWIVMYGGSWYIGESSKLEADDGDYYRNDTHDDHLPSVMNWETAESGADPAPSLMPILEGPAAYAVQGAGTATANGVYVRDGMHQGSPLYRHERGHLVLIRTSGNRYRWMIADKEKLEETDGDLYCTESCSEYPPTGDAWTVGGDGDNPGESDELQGLKPAPTVVAMGADGVALKLEWVPAMQGTTPAISIPTAAAAAVQFVPNYVMQTTTTTTTMAAPVVMAMPVA